MALINKLEAIANAIRQKTNKSNKMTLEEMVTEINSIETEVIINPVLQEKTITPTKASQNVTADANYDGLSKVTVNQIPNEYITTSDANAVQTDIIKDKTAYVKGEKITGTLVINKYYEGSSEPSASLGSNGDIYLKRG